MESRSSLLKTSPLQRNRSQSFFPWMRSGATNSSPYLDSQVEKAHSGVLSAVELSRYPKVVATLSAELKLEREEKLLFYYRNKPQLQIGGPTVVEADDCVVITHYRLYWKAGTLKKELSLANISEINQTFVGSHRWTALTFVMDSGDKFTLNISSGKAAAFLTSKLQRYIELLAAVKKQGRSVPSATEVAIALSDTKLDEDIPGNPQLGRHPSGPEVEPLSKIVLTLQRISLSNGALEALVSEMKSGPHAVALKDHRMMLTVHKNSFRSRDAVDWVMAYCRRRAVMSEMKPSDVEAFGGSNERQYRAPDRADAVELLRSLINVGLVIPVASDEELQDTGALLQFPGEEIGGLIGPTQMMAVLNRRLEQQFDERKPFTAVAVPIRSKTRDDPTRSPIPGGREFSKLERKQRASSEMSEMKPDEVLDLSVSLLVSMVKAICATPAVQQQEYTVTHATRKAVRLSPQWRQACEATAALYLSLTDQDIDKLSLEERTCFFLNIYSTLSLHACVNFLSTGSTLSRNVFKLAGYEIGSSGLSFSLLDLEHRVLRSPNSTALLPKIPGLAELLVGNSSFGEDDPRTAWSCQSLWNPLMNFALASGCKSSPRMRVFWEPAELGETLTSCARDYVLNHLQLGFPPDGLTGQGSGGGAGGGGGGGGSSGNAGTQILPTTVTQIIPGVTKADSKSNLFDQLLRLKVYLPKLMAWYMTDFASNPREMLEWLTPYLPLSARLRVQQKIPEEQLDKTKFMVQPYNFAFFIDLSHRPDLEVEKKKDAIRRGLRKRIFLRDRQQVDVVKPDGVNELEDLWNLLITSRMETSWVAEVRNVNELKLLCSPTSRRPLGNLVAKYVASWRGAYANAPPVQGEPHPGLSKIIAFIAGMHVLVSQNKEVTISESDIELGDREKARTDERAQARNSVLVQQNNGDGSPPTQLGIGAKASAVVASQSAAFTELEALEVVEHGFFEAVFPHVHSWYRKNYGSLDNGLAARHSALQKLPGKGVTLLQLKLDDFFRLDEDLYLAGESNEVPYARAIQMFSKLTPQQTNNTPTTISPLATILLLYEIVDEISGTLSDFWEDTSSVASPQSTESEGKSESGEVAKPKRRVPKSRKNMAADDLLLVLAYIAIHATSPLDGLIPITYLLRDYLEATETIPQNALPSAKVAYETIHFGKGGFCLTTLQGALRYIATSEDLNPANLN